MNPFQRARDEAKATRKLLLSGGACKNITAKEILQAVEDILGIAIESVAPTYPDLGQGSAVLQREQKFIYVSNAIPIWKDEFCGLIAHELGHWFLDSSKASSTVSSLKTLFQSDGSPAVMKVEAYGARERQELQANVFARELLLPREFAKILLREGKGPSQVSNELGIPLEFARLQMLDALLLPSPEDSVTSTYPPSPDQYTAAMAEERAANVVAGPGTGKTSTLIYRVQYLIEVKKVDPSEILVLTFTNKAAFELVERLRIAGIKSATDVWAGTFHAFGLEFLRKYHQMFNLDSDLKVADRMTSMDMLVNGLPALKLSYYLRVEDPYDWLNSAVDGIKRMKEELVSTIDYRNFVTKFPSEDVELQRQREDVATLYEAHERLLSEHKIVDFVDLVAKPAIELKRNRTKFIELADQFQYILVDEYQDVTQAMVELLRQLAQKAKSIWVVGDIRQAIHHWRGASLKSLLKFDAEFKAHANGSKIKRYNLDTNRRSCQEILDLVQEVGRKHMLESSLPLDKLIAEKGACGEMPTVVTCAKRDELLNAVVENVLSLQQKGVPFGQQAVISRSGSDIQQAAELLSSRGIPVIYIGELAQRLEIKNVICLMQLLVERQPRALIGLSTVPELKMPIKDIQFLLQTTDKNVSLQRGRWIHNPPEGLSTAGLIVISRLRKLVGSRNHGTTPWSFVCDMLLEHKFSIPNDTDDSVSAWVKRIALWQFAYAVRNGEGDRKDARLTRFLIRQRLRQRVGEAYVDRELPPEASSLDGVRMLTVHGSKGLEFEATHVAFVNASSYSASNPSWLPADNVLEIVPPEAIGSTKDDYAYESAIERNNLLYVAFSRAKRHLYIYQENEFGDDTLAPQLQHYPRKYQQKNFNGSSSHQNIITSNGSFIPSAVVNFEHFVTYTICPLQYWYSQILLLKNEADTDISIRARWVVMSALKIVASGNIGEPDSHFRLVWAEQKLPSEIEDPSLWRDAILAFSRGLKVIRTILNQGGIFSEPKSVVGGVTIQMPWGFIINRSYSTEFAMMRFTRRGFSEISTVLKPMIPGLILTGTKKLTLNYVLSEKFHDVPGGKRLEATKSFKAAVRMLAGDNSPKKGRHCGRCAYMTICPTSPNIGT